MDHTVRDWPTSVVLRSEPTCNTLALAMQCAERAPRGALLSLFSRCTLTCLIPLWRPQRDSWLQ